MGEKLIFQFSSHDMKIALAEYASRKTGRPYDGRDVKIEIRQKEEHEITPAQPDPYILSVAAIRTVPEAFGSTDVDAKDGELHIDEAGLLGEEIARAKNVPKGQDSST